MDRNALVGRLQGLEKMRREVQLVDDALCELPPEDRLVLDYLVIRPRRGGADLLCQYLQVERSSVYRRKDRALRRLEEYLGNG